MKEFKKVAGIELKYGYNVVLVYKYGHEKFNTVK